MDNFMLTHKINKICFLKLDVEGSNYEVLEGFGIKITDINAVHEAEHINNMYRGNIYLFDAISNLLSTNGFELISFQRYSSQPDSFWVRKEFIKSI
jgi:hypothetical protein